MTPYEIKLILHIGTTRSECENTDLPLFKDTIGRFLRDGLIEPYDDNIYKCTSRGECFIKFLCNVGLPTRLWVDSTVTMAAIEDHELVK